MSKHNLTYFVIGGFLLYGILSGIILFSYHTRTEALLEEQERLSESNKELNEKYENLLQVVNKTQKPLESSLEEE